MIGAVSPAGFLQTKSFNLNQIIMKLVPLQRQDVFYKPLDFFNNELWISVYGGTGEISFCPAIKEFISLGSSSSFRFLTQKDFPAYYLELIPISDKSVYKIITKPSIVSITLLTLANEIIRDFLSFNP